MKKIVLATLAVVSVATLPNLSEAAGGSGKSGRPKAVLDAKTRDARADALIRSRTGGDVAGSTVYGKLDSSGFLADLSPNQRSNLSKNSKDPEIETALKDIFQNMQSPEFRDLAAARLRAISNIPAGVKLDQAPDVLASLTADKQADLTFDRLAMRTYIKELSPEVREHVTFLLNRASEIVEASGGRKSRGQALREANDAMAEPAAKGGRSTRLDLENVNKYCK